jgi:ABC-type sugar transport system substrate-binding protein
VSSILGGSPRRAVALLALLGLAIVPVLVSPASAGQTRGNAKQLVIGIADIGHQYPFDAAMFASFKAEAARLGIKLRVTDAQGNAQKQANDVQDLITLKPDGMIIVPVNGPASRSLVDRVNRAGIPIIAVATQVGAPGTPVRTVYKGLAAIVIQDEVETGRIIARQVLRLLPKGGDIGVVTGPPGFNEVGWRLQGFEQVLKQNPAFKIVAKQPGDWDPVKGQAACQNMLAANPRIALFYAQEDLMGVGCKRAVDSAGSHALVVNNSGGTKAGIAAIKAGKIAGALCFQPRTMAALGVRVIVKRVREGKLPKRFYSYPTPWITKRNLNQCPATW